MTIADAGRRRRFARVRRCVLVAAACGSTALPCHATEPFSFTPAARYLPHVPPPAVLLGHELGDRFTPHAAVVRTLRGIAAATDRLRLLEYGVTYGGRPLVLVLASSPRNLARLRAVEEGLALLSDPRLPADPGRRDALLDELPVVVWLSCSVHGNEPSGTEAALAVAFHLAAADDPAVETLLDDVLVVLDPCLNPDGRDRYVHWYAAVAGARPDPDPQSAEHHEPWPGGRSNHYYFDLNRDWAFLTQVESRARLHAYRRLSPQVHADLHEMGHESSYFFFPAAAPVNDNLPRSTLRWGEAFGRTNAAAFDRFGWSYFTEEAFDLFYPGYGDSWPSLNGAIGMTYEQAGHGRAGLAVRRRDGSVLTLAERVAHHFTAALATIETAAANRRGLLRHFQTFFADALWEGTHGDVAEYLLVDDGTGRADELVALLLLQGIEVERSEAAFHVAECHPHDGGPAVAQTFPEGTWIVPLDQPRQRLANALLEPRASVREVRFYDLSAWSLPLAFGVESFWSAERTVAPRAPVRAQPRPACGLAGEPDPAVGWLIRWDGGGAPRLLDRLLRQDVRVRAATEAFALEDGAWPAGTLFVPRAGNPDDVGARLERLARDAGAVAHGVARGLTRSGPDLGSDAFQDLAPVALAIVTGEGTAAGSVGALRHLLEHRQGMPFSRLPLAELGAADLRPYNVLVLPDGGGYRHALGEEGAARLRRWVEAGGTLVGLAGGAFYLAAEENGLTAISTGETPEPPAEAAAAGAGDERWTMLRESSERRHERDVPGTLFRTRLDPDHPLSFGYPESIAVLMSSTRAFHLDGPGRRLAVFEEDPWLSGYASPENVDKLEGQAYLAEVPVGAGNIILFAGDPTFRGLVRGQTGLLLNAIQLFAQRPVR